MDKYQALADACAARQDLDQARLTLELEQIKAFGLVDQFYQLFERGEVGDRNDVNSLVAYALGFTTAFPEDDFAPRIQFVNARVTMPDFDLDFPDDQREEMIRYTIDKYGSDHVAQIVAFGRMKARAAVRDVGRAMDIPLPDVDAIAKLIPAIPGKPVTIAQALGRDEAKPELVVPDLVARYQSDKSVRELLDTAAALDGVARHASTHAAAVIITDKPLVEYLPVMRPQKAVITDSVTQFEFPICESIGLLKVDFLGLRTLTIMREATRLIEERHGRAYRLDTIPLDDVASYKLLSSGEVSGVFQVEGAGLRRVLVEMRPTEFNHIVAAISLFRPGPMDFIPEYIAVMHGVKDAQYVHPALEPILGETYGVCVFQEQVIQLLTDIAGYTAGDADLVRRGISKKKEKVLQEHREIFAAGAKAKSGLTRREADAIWDALMGFARYGFNRAHAADYAVITVETAYLKAHYPLEYMAALLLVERDNTDKVAYYITECRRMGIEVLAPDINASGMDFTLEQLPPGAEDPVGKDSRLGYPFPVPDRAAIRYGLAAIKNVGEGPVEAILEAREAGGPFHGIADFSERVDLRRVGKRALECLIKVGALDQLGERAQLLAAMDQMIGVSKQKHDAAAVGQLSMFELLGATDMGGGTLALTLPDVAPMPPKQRLLHEKELLGVYVSEHPLQQMSVDLSGVITCFCGDLDETYADKTVVLAGNIARVNRITTKGKKPQPMAFVTLEDIQGQCDVVVFPKVWAETADLWQTDKIVLVRGKVNLRGEQVSVICETVQDYVVRALAADEGEDPWASLRVEPRFHNANGSAAVATFDQPVDVEADLAYDHGSGGDDDGGEDHNPFALEEPEWLRTAPPAGPMAPLPADAQAPRLDSRSQQRQAETGEPNGGAGAQVARPAVEVRITIQRTFDVEKDKKLLTWVYDLLRERPGADRFCIILRKNGECTRLDFPNDSTTFDPALERQIVRRLGAGNVEVLELD